MANEDEDLLASLRGTLKDTPNIGLGEQYPWRGDAPDEGDPEALKKPPDDKPMVIVVGGMGSKYDDKFYEEIRDTLGSDVDPQQIPIGELGLQGAIDAIKRTKSGLKAAGRKGIFIGHSLGATALHNIEDEDRLNPDMNSTHLLVDPPWSPPWENAPSFIKGLSPTAEAIDRASGGIRYNPGLIDFTGGKTVMYGRDEGHAPWNNPSAPGNQERLDTLRGRLRDTYDFLTPKPTTAKPAPSPVKGPG